MRSVMLSALTLTLLATPLFADEPAAPKKKALLVGVSTYQKSNLADKPLPFAATDMELLAVELTMAGWEVQLLVSKGTTNNATRAGVAAALDKLLKGVNASDFVLIALSGHGQQFKAKIDIDDGLKNQEESFFCPSDGETGDPGTLLGMTELTRRLGQKGGKNLVLVDACRDDPRRGGKGVDGNTARNVPGNTSILFSCAAGQQSFETNQMFGKGSTDGHGVFFHRVLKALQGDVRNDLGEITWDDVQKYVRETVNDDAVLWFPERAVTNAAGEKIVQTPHSVGSFVGRSPVLVKLPSNVELGEIVNELKRLRCKVTNPSGETRLLQLSVGLPRYVGNDNLSEFIALLKRLHFPLQLWMSDTHIDDEGLKQLTALKKLTGLMFVNARVTDAGIKYVGSWPQVEILGFAGTEITDAGLKELAPLKRLHGLALNQTRITDAGLRELAAIRTLRELNLSDTRITEAGLQELTALDDLQVLQLARNTIGRDGWQHLSKCPKLQTLILTGCKIGDDDLLELARIKSLTDLDLTGTRITGKGLAHLQPLAGLRGLVLARTQIDNDALKVLAGWPKLELLSLSGTRVGDDGLKNLTALNQLTDLDVSSTCVGDACLEHLYNLKHLLTLKIGDTNVTEAGLRALKRKLPIVELMN